jgi:hypothetical protein
MSIRCLSLLLSLPLLLAAESDSAQPVQGLMILQAGQASTFALPLADFGSGSGQQDMALFQFNNLFTKHDGLTVYGWQTIDSNGTIDWDATIGYRRPVATLKHGVISAGTGLQRWHLPSIAYTEDWVLDNSLYYNLPGRFPLSVQANLKTAVVSNKEFAEGSFLVLTAETSRTLLNKSGYSLSLRHGPTYVHGLGMYSVNGSRGFRYGGALTVSHKGFNLAFQARPQIGLQAGLKNSIFWGVSLTKVIRMFGRD